MDSGSPPPRARTTRRVVGLVIALTGLVWIGQGLGYLRSSSFMVDDIRWAIIGVVFVLVGLVVLARTRTVTR